MMGLHLHSRFSHQRDNGVTNMGDDYMGDDGEYFFVLSIHMSVATPRGRDVD